jgi:hypothetical protein
MNPGEREEQARLRIRRLERLAGRSRLALILFVVVSVAAMLHFLYLPAFPREIRAFLGAPPPTWLISVALVLYAFSALVLTLGRLTKNEEAFHGWSHLGYAGAFYFFYYYAGELAGHFWGVFAAGLTILVLENYRVGSHVDEEMKKEREVLARLKRGFLPPTGER